MGLEVNFYYLSLFRDLKYFISMMLFIGKKLLIQLRLRHARHFKMNLLFLKDAHVVFLKMTRNGHNVVYYTIYIVHGD